MTTVNTTDLKAETDLSRVLDPNSVAVVGASTDPAKRGHQTLVDLEASGYEGDVYPVNPKYDRDIRGRTVYPSVADIPDRVDLAFVATPASTVPAVLEDCGDAGVAGAVVIAAGFSEVGEDDLEMRTLETAHEQGVRLIGPNIQGIANLHSGLNLLGGYDVPEGNLALLSQSGNLGLEMGSHAEDRSETGFSFNVGIGNETDLQFHEFLPYLDEHDDTDGILLYVDGMADGREFLREAREVVTETPIVILKGGVTDAGQESAESHTSSLAGNGAIVDAAYRQAGVVRAERSDEAVAIADALAKLPPASGENVAILTDGGGNATLGADAVVDSGLSLPDLTAETRDRLRDLVPEAPNLSNPVDIMGLQGDGDLSIFSACAEVLLRDPNVDSLLLTGAFGAYESYGPGDSESNQEPDVARDIATLAHEHETPVTVHCIYGTQGSPALDAFESAGVPTYGSLDAAVTSLEKLAQYGVHRQNADRKSTFVLPDDVSEHDQRSSTLANADVTEPTTLSEFGSRRVLSEGGLPVGRFELATSPDDAAAAVNEFDAPVAMKIASDDIVHKTDAGGVELDVANPDAARETYDRIVQNAAAYDPDADVDGVLVTPMLDSGTEFIVGVVRDPEVGPVVMFGVGGVYVEVLDDVAFRALPLTESDARGLLDDIDSQAFLDGARGEAGVDRDALVGLLRSVSDFVAANPEVRELDLNPVFAYEDGAAVVDASLTLSPPER